MQANRFKATEKENTIDPRQADELTRLESICLTLPLEIQNVSNIDCRFVFISAL